MKNFKKDDLLMIINKYQNYVNQFINISDEDIDKLYFEIAKDDNYEDELLQQKKVLNNIFDIYGDVFVKNNNN